MPSGVLPLTFQAEGVSDLFLIQPIVIKIPLLNADSVDPDQTPRSALGMYGLAMSFI